MTYEERWLHRFEIKPGRWVFHPTEATKEYGASLHRLLKNKFTLPYNYWHLKKGGHIQALRSHLTNRYFLKLDIADFFGSINKTRVTRILKPLFGYKAARKIANRSTVPHPISGHSILPYGFNQSMILASLALAHSALGGYLRKLERELSCKVSVYVDDIIVSSKNQHLLNHSFEVLKERADRSGFFLNLAKTQAPDRSITAFNIILEHQNLSITNKKMSEFLFAIATTQCANRKEGIKNYIKTINYYQWSQIPQL